MEDSNPAPESVEEQAPQNQPEQPTGTQPDTTPDQPTDSAKTAEPVESSGSVELPEDIDESIKPIVERKVTSALTKMRQKDKAKLNEELAKVRSQAASPVAPSQQPLDPRAEQLLNLPEQVKALNQKLSELSDYQARITEQQEQARSYEQTKQEASELVKADPASAKYLKQIAYVAAGDGSSMKEAWKALRQAVQSEKDSVSKRVAENVRSEPISSAPTGARAPEVDMSELIKEAQKTGDWTKVNEANGSLDILMGKSK